MFIYVGGGGGAKAAIQCTCFQNGACCVEPDGKIVKADFCSFATSLIKIHF